MRAEVSIRYLQHQAAPPRLYFECFSSISVQIQNQQEEQTHYFKENTV